MIEFTLPDMTCGHCVQTVKRTVQQIDAAARVEVDLPAHRVRVESTHDRAEFARALADEGYPAAA
jgi:copper chaperone